jgi:hypothetical protein
MSVYTDNDERLLVDIEKLIKQTITRGELTGYAPVRARERSSGDRPGSERASSERPSSERRGRREVDGPRSFERGGERSERGPRGPGAPRREKVDPWFLKPYEPAAAPRRDPAEAVPVSSSNKPKQQLAALLGGLPKQ